MSTHRQDCSRFGRYRKPYFALDPRVAVACYSVRGSVPRMPRRARLSQVSLFVVQYRDERPYLRRYRLEARLHDDGSVRVGPDTLAAEYDLSLNWARRRESGFLDQSRRRLETRVAARARASLEAASVVTNFIEFQPGVLVRRVHFTSALPTPPVTFGYDRPLLMHRSAALVNLARQRFALGAADPTVEQLRAAWDGVPELYLDGGGRQFLYPSRFVAVGPWPTTDADGRTSLVHPSLDVPMPDAAPPTYAAHRCWAFVDGAWRPRIPAGATVWFNGARIAGVGCHNPAFKVLRDLSFVGESDTLESLLDDEVELARIRRVLMEMPPAARAEVGERMRRLARNDVGFTDDDVFTALLNPGDAMRASEEPEFHLIRDSALRTSSPGWDVDLSAVLGRTTPTPGAADGDVDLAVVGGADAPGRAG